VVGCCEHCSEYTGSVEGEEIIDKVSDYQLRKKDSSP
jgi:hypothetical protein